MNELFEYRGVEDLVYAKVIKDDNEGYETGEVKPIAGVAEIGKTTETSSEAHYYDNVAAITVTSTGPDEVTCTVSAIPLEVLADITGQAYDKDTGTLVEGERETNYYALGYRTKKTNDEEVLVWRYKGTFAIPESKHKTEDAGTEANGQEITYTGISTTYRFQKTGKRAKAINVDMEKGLVDASTFFDQVTTIDMLEAKTPAVEAKG